MKTFHATINRMKCPCHSSLSYATCCQPIHLLRNASTPEKLMRSRYSAYSLAIIDYIIETTHPENIKYKNDKSIWKQEILEFCKQTEFKNLEILKVEEISPEEGYVTFLATLLQNNKDISFQEKSLFHRVDGKWLYVSGVLSSSVTNE